MNANLSYLEQINNELKDTNDWVILSKLCSVANPLYLKPNVRMKVRHFLSPNIELYKENDFVIGLQYSYQSETVIHSLVEKIFDEANYLVKKKFQFVLESDHLFVLDRRRKEETMLTSQNDYLYIPKYYYRRRIYDVPELLAAENVILVDYTNDVAFKVGISYQENCNKNIKVSHIETDTYEERTKHGEKSDWEAKNIIDMMAENASIYNAPFDKTLGLEEVTEPLTTDTTGTSYPSDSKAPHFQNYDVTTERIKDVKFVMRTKKHSTTVKKEHRK